MLSAIGTVRTHVYTPPKGNTNMAITQGVEVAGVGKAFPRSASTRRTNVSKSASSALPK